MFFCLNVLSSVIIVSLSIYKIGFLFGASFHALNWLMISLSILIFYIRKFVFVHICYAFSNFPMQKCKLVSEYPRKKAKKMLYTDSKPMKPSLDRLIGCPYWS